jgi:hypothetical protein
MLAPFEEDVASLRSRPAPIIAQERVKGTSRIENPLHGAGSGRQARCVWLGSTSRAVSVKPISALCPQLHQGLWRRPLGGALLCRHSGPRTGHAPRPHPRRAGSSVVGCRPYNLFDPSRPGSLPGLGSLPDIRKIGQNYENVRKIAWTWVEKCGKLMTGLIFDDKATHSIISMYQHFVRSYMTFVLSLRKALFS